MEIIFTRIKVCPYQGDGLKSALYEPPEMYYYIPRLFYLVQELPFKPAGKIHKALLKEKYLNKNIEE